MEFIIWFIVIVVLTFGTVAFMRSPFFQKALLPKQVKQVGPAKTLKQVHEEDHKFWLEEYRAILQKDCDHLYHHQDWYHCRMCGYEEPWVYEKGCGCTKEEVRALTDINPTYHLITRQSFCKVHGIDFKIFPISDRKRGPYGPQSDSQGSIERSRELTKGRSMRRIADDIEGSN